jgi:hypothetical protein
VDCRLSLARLCLSGARANKAVVLSDDYPRSCRRDAGASGGANRPRHSTSAIAGALRESTVKAKSCHGLARAVRRGLSNRKIQAHLTVAAINLKRLAAFLAGALGGLAAIILDMLEAGTPNPAAPSSPE